MPKIRIKRGWRKVKGGSGYEKVTRSKKRLYAHRRQANDEKLQAVVAAIVSKGLGQL